MTTAAPTTVRQALAQVQLQATQQQAHSIAYQANRVAQALEALAAAQSAMQETLATMLDLEPTASNAALAYRLAEAHNRIIGALESGTLIHCGSISATRIAAGTISADRISTQNNLATSG